jgi:CheY-like chemotaxis protein
MAYGQSRTNDEGGPGMLAAPRQPPISRTILVVDDHDDIRGLLRALIERGPHRVVEAVDGDEALALIARAAPDLILLDMSMPTIDGTEVCRRVKSDPSTHAIPVVMLTAATVDAERKRALDAGADAYVTKPFSPLSLLDEIDAHLAAA